MHQALRVDIYNCFGKLASLYDSVGESEKAFNAKKRRQSLLEENDLAEILG